MYMIGILWPTPEPEFIIIPPFLGFHFAAVAIGGISKTVGSEGFFRHDISPLYMDGYHHIFP